MLDVSILIEETLTLYWTIIISTVQVHVISDTYWHFSLFYPFFYMIHIARATGQHSPYLTMRYKGIMKLRFLNYHFFIHGLTILSHLSFLQWVSIYMKSLLLLSRGGECVLCFRETCPPAPSHVLDPDICDNFSVR